MMLCIFWNLDLFYARRRNAKCNLRENREIHHFSYLHVKINVMMTKMKKKSKQMKILKNEK